MRRKPKASFFGALTDAIPPSGRSTPDRSALARESSNARPSSGDGERLYTTSEVESACGDSVANIRERMQNAGEHDIVVTINGQGHTRREFVVEIARARRLLGLEPPKCDHGKVSPLDQLCLSCGEIMVKQPRPDPPT